MNVKDLVSTITPEVYNGLKRSLELGKWGDGQKLTAEQKQHCMDMIILYENFHKIPEEQQTGYLGRTKEKKTPCETQREKQMVGSYDPANPVGAGDNTALDTLH